MILPFVDKQPVPRVAVEPAGIQEGLDELGRRARPVARLCDGSVRQATDVTLDRVVSGEVPQQHQVTQRLGSRAFQPGREVEGFGVP